jgi:tripartite-type tricarboxylate transporter receptor subunit TctC
MFGLKGKTSRIIFLIAIILLFCSVPGMAADYPTKPISLILPFGPGGSTDLTGRALFNAAKPYLGQPIISENKAGGGGTVGISLLLQKAPDGYTLAILPCVAVMTAYHMGKINFNPVGDLTHIFRYTSYQNGLVVRADAPWKTIQDFIKYVKENPQKVSCGTPGVGTASHLMMEDFSMLAGNLQMLHIPYKGDAETNTALLGGHVDSVLTSSSWAPLVDAGKFRLLVTYTSQRLERYPQVPTFKEIGYEMAYTSPLIVVGPKGIPQPIVKRLHEVLKKASDNPEYLATLKKLDLPPIYLPLEDLEMAARNESDAIGKTVRKLGLSKQQ